MLGETKRMTKKKKMFEMKLKKKKERKKTRFVPSTNSQLFVYYWEIEKKNGRKVDS